MEPRLLRRGNAARRASSAISKWLQWSHAFSDVETESSGESCDLRAGLQWSHAFSDVETVYTTPSNTMWLLLQWSHAFSDVETLG